MTSYYSDKQNTKAPKATYDPNVDYTALINKAVETGDWDAAKGYDEQRNAKLADMNAAGTNTGGYTTGYYAQAVKDKYAGTDYTAQINEAIRTGDVFGGMQLDALRNEKLDAYNSAGLNQEGYEKDYYKNWLTNYINAQNSGQSVGLVDENGNRTTGVTSTAMSYYDDQLKKLEEMRAADIARGDSYYASAVAEAEAQLQAQKDAINLNYDDLTKQHYIDREMAKKDLPQQMAALGLTGGLAESSLLGIGYDYENNLNAAERARSQQLTEQQNYYAQALRDAAREKADMDSAAQQQYFNYYQQAMADKIAQQQYEEQMAYQRERDALANQRYDTEWAYQQQLDQQSAVKNMVAMGIIPSADVLAAAYGLSPEEVESYRKQLEAANAPTYYYTPQTVEETPKFSETGASTTPTVAGEGYRPSEWSYIVNNVKTNIRNNNPEAVKTYMETLRDGGYISTSQWNELAAMLAAEGWTDVPRY